MRAARFDVAESLLHDALHLPATAHIIGVVYNVGVDTLTFVIDDPSLPEANQPHDCLPTVTERRCEWNWNVS